MLNLAFKLSLIAVSVIILLGYGVFGVVPHIFSMPWDFGPPVAMVVLVFLLYTIALLVKFGYRCVDSYNNPKQEVLKEGVHDEKK